MMEQLAPVGIGATSYSALALELVVLIVLSAAATLDAIFWLMPRPSAFATFWDQIESPIPPPPPPVKISWVAIGIVVVVATILILVTLYILISLQNNLLPYTNYCASPQNMSQACQNLRQIINNSIQ